MHHTDSFPPIINAIIQIFSKFLSKMMETGMLKTYTFLYTVEYSYTRDGYNDALNAIDDLKDPLFKILSELENSRTMCNSQVYNDLLSSNDAINAPSYHQRHSAEDSYNNHERNFHDIYNENTVVHNHSSLNDNLHFSMYNNLPQNGVICDDMAQSLAASQANGGMCSNMDFRHNELPNDQLEQGGANLDFKDCDQNMSYSGTNDLISYEADNVNYPKNDASDVNHSMHGNCNDSLFNTLKDSISGDFLQSIKFSQVENDNRPIDANLDFAQQVNYGQCPPSLQQIDLDILHNSNDRITSAIDRILGHQFVDNDALLEPACWNVDINLPSTGPLSTNIDIPNNEFVLPGIKENINGASADLENSFHVVKSGIENPVEIACSEFDGELDGVKYFCEHCVFICNTKFKLRIHLKKMHNIYTNNEHKCAECGKCFKAKSILNKHSTIHQTIKPFKCHFCGNSFSQKITLDSHLQLHNNGYKFSCPMCEKRFPTQAKLNFHSKSHKDPEFSCQICNKMFTTKQYLKNHLNSHAKIETGSEKHYTCVKCNMSFSKNSHLCDHIKENHPDFAYICHYSQCDRKYDTYKKLRDHIYKKHTHQKISTKKDDGKYKCDQCESTFVEKSSYLRHNLLSHCEEIDVDKSFNCMHCEKRFVHEMALDDHLERFHNDSATHSKDMDYSCSVCGSLFYEQKSLNEHMHIHSDFSSTYICHVCGSIFSQKNDYLAHQSAHETKKDHSIRKHKCDTCDMGFELKMELKQHELEVHNIVPDLEELKPFKCSYCEKRFTHKGKCNIHMETHSNIPKYQCDTCSKHFFRRDLLKSHQMTHVNGTNSQQSHVCKVCGLQFNLKSNLKSHEAMHKNSSTASTTTKKIKPEFTCDTCDKKFKSKQALTFHTQFHEGKFRFNCDVCGKQFVRKCHYAAHILCHSNDRCVKCEKCDKTFKNNRQLREHSVKMHQNETNINSLLESIYNEESTMPQHDILVDEFNIPSIL